MPGLYLLSDKINDLTKLKNFKTTRIMGSLKSLQEKIALNFKNDRLLQACVSGTIYLKLSNEDTDIAIAGPNGAAAGTFKRRVIVRVLTAADEIVHVLDGIVPTITPGKTGAGFSNPIISPATPVIKKGICAFDLVYTTDSGSTEVYAAADKVTCAVDLSVCGIALSQVVLTETMIA